MFRSVYHIVRGWLTLLALITVSSFARRARLRRCGRNVRVSPTAQFKSPENIEIGNDTFINHLCCVWAAPNGRIRIGDDVLLGPRVSIIASNHRTALGQPIRLQPWQDKDITIGNDVWLGAHVVVTAGVTIGDGCVVGAGAVVTKDLPPFSICVGVPARPIASRMAPAVAGDAHA
jgi:acetyltransferase-like isoleucine patch superfamily enzyme